MSSRRYSLVEPCAPSRCTFCSSFSRNAAGSEMLMADCLAFMGLSGALTTFSVKLCQIVLERNGEAGEGPLSALRTLGCVD